MAIWDSAPEVIKIKLLPGTCTAFCHGAVNFLNGKSDGLRQSILAAFLFIIKKYLILNNYMSKEMTCTLSFIEVINAKRATEKAIAKLLHDLQEETGIQVENIRLEKLIGSERPIVKIDSSINNLR